AQHIETLLRALVAGGERLAVDVDPLSAREYHDLVYARNTTDKPFPTDITLPELFAGQVARAPQQTVLIEPDGNRISAAELYRRATDVAIRLRGCGVVPDDRVAVLVERGSYLMPAILGIQLAGAAYVPIDPNYPLERIELLLEDCAARVALVVDLALPSAACPVLRMVDMPLAPGEPLLPVAGPNHLAYVIYTSGSTGTPKGVMVEHRSVVNRLHWMQREYPIDETDVLLQKTPIAFDVSVWELFWWSFTGAKLSLLTPGAEKDPREVLHVI
ncbi:non-ribosomal peptide synthetase, partial [Corynebacterium pseudodiphtheriticum]